MCRLFGFRSVIPSQVHRSLLVADNAIGKQSTQHPDGWGVAFYVDRVPHTTKSTHTALGDQLFSRVSAVASSETVLAHVRKATQGDRTVLNCHPFQHGRWLFAHNGDVPAFPEKRRALLGEVAPNLRGFVLGDTDSEVVFHLLLTQLQRFGPLSRDHSLTDIASAIRTTVQRVRGLCDGAGARSLLTFILTDGTTMMAHQGGKELHWSTYKRLCSDRDACTFLSAECEAPTVNGFVNHLIFSSEPLQNDNVWEAMAPGDLIGIDHRMHLFRSHVDSATLPVVA